MREDTMHTSARRSLLSVIVTAVLITVNHLYPLGTRALGLGAMLVLVPTALLWWFRTTRSRVAFTGYLLMNLWIVIGFGLIKGLWKSTLPVDRKSTRLNSSQTVRSYAVFCVRKKITQPLPYC